MLFVIAVDVAHVHTTLFRTYFDREELARRRSLYALLPVGVYAAGVLLHARSSLLFWRVLAYVAVFHFVRQQVGWVAICRARAGERDRAGRWLDLGLTYAATLYPIACWHAGPPRAFRWFVDDDFLFWPALAGWIPAFGVVYASLAVVYTARAAVQYARSGFTSWGKHLVILSTAALWYVGIVATNDDFTFTVTNVLGHGVPYGVLLWMYAKARAGEAPSVLGSRVVRLGAAAFVGTVLVIAFAEEGLWDRLVWHQAPWLFGGVESDKPLFSPLVRTLLVPLLAVPQATHYVLDAVLWRRRDTGRAQAEALGFATG